MQYTLSTISALVAALSLASAAPMPNNNGNSNSNSASSSSGSETVTILRQLAGFDAASTLQAKLDATTPNNGNVKSASLRTAGPWCAGFSDAQATQPVPALNGDGIFDSENEAVYTEDVNDAVPVGSWWCAATRGEVEDFVANAIGGGNGNGNGNDNANNNDDADAVNNGANNGGDAAQTVRVQIELEAGTTFVQEELPANVGEVDASETRQLGNGVVSVQVNGEGDCAFFDAQGNTLDVSGSSSSNDLIQIATFTCEI